MSLGLNLYDVNDIVDRVMAKQYPKYFRLQTAKSAEAIQLSSYGTLRSLFATLQTQMTKVSDAFKTVSLAASSANSAIATATVTSNEVGVGSHTVVVSQLAQSQRYTSDKNFASKNTALSIDETLTFTNTTNSSSHFEVDIAPTDSLEKIRDKINNASDNIGVTAAIVSSTGSGGATEYRLVLTEKSGLENQVTITGDTGNKFDFTQTIAAKNAMFTFDGLNVEKASNLVTDVMDGLSLSLTGIGTTTISVNEGSVDMKSKLFGAITDMLAAYNQIMTFLDGNKTVTVKDDNTKVSTTLESTPFGFIKSRLQNAMNSVVSGFGHVKTIRGAGIVLSPAKQVIDQYDQEKEVTTVGSLNIDTKTYQEYGDDTQFNWLVDNDFDNLKNFFTDKDNGLFKAINSAIDDKITPNDKTGLIWAAEQAIGKIQTQTELSITNEKNRLDTVKGELIDTFSRINGVISYYQTLSDALEKQYAYLNNMIKGK